MIVVNMDPSLPLDQTITGKTDFLVTEHGALGIAIMPSSLGGVSVQ